MKLSFILEQARNSELFSLSNKKFTDRVIVSHLNLAMIELYNRFDLATEEAIVTLRPDIPKTVYTLSSSDPDVTVGDEPLVDHTFKSIMSIYDDKGRQLSLNDEEDPRSIYTITYNQIQVPLVDDISYLSVIYKCNPEPVEFVDDGNGNAVDTEVRLPTQLIEAVLHYIGYRAYLALNGDNQNNSNVYYKYFLNACSQAETLGLVTSSTVPAINVVKRGYL